MSQERKKVKNIYEFNSVYEDNSKGSNDRTWESNLSKGCCGIIYIVPTYNVEQQQRDLPSLGCHLGTTMILIGTWKSWFASVK